MIPPLLVLLSCGNINRPPKIQAFNGYPAERDIWGDVRIDHQFLYDPGDTIDFSLDVLDPELQQLSIWWPESPPGFDFPYDGTEGTWEVPLDLDAAGWSFDPIVEDPFGETDTMQIWFWASADYYVEPYYDAL